MGELIGLLASVLQLVDVVAGAGKLVKDLHNAPKEQQRLFSEIESLRPLIAALQDRVGHPTSYTARAAAERARMVHAAHVRRVGAPSGGYAPAASRFNLSAMRTLANMLRRWPIMLLIPERSRFPSHYLFNGHMTQIGVHLLTG
ncbi:hypothetical protein DFH09DRAFT_1491941 [Mycena vulgaris]|nr:hypothetical protein DFH09DRAFT_1491941 [Mycena vulgaris]